MFEAEGPSRQKPNFREGHIRRSINLPFTELIDKDTGCLVSNKELAAVILHKDIDTTLPIVATCHSGVTACMAELAVKILGADRTILYDGSWSEYGSIEEPDFYHGNKHGWDEKVTDSVDRMMLDRNPEKYKQYLEEKKFNTKMRQAELDQQNLEEELKA